MTRNSSAGFTLLELMVATAVTLLLVAMLASTLSGTLRIWERGRSNISTYSSARTILVHLGDELQGAVAAEDGPHYVENFSPSGDVTAVAKTAENVFFVAPYPNVAEGDLCVLAYRLNPVTYQLERAFVPSELAWEKGYTVGAYPAQSLTWLPFAEGVLEFEVKSFSQQNLNDDSAPVDTWDSRATADLEMHGRIPRAVGLRLKVASDKTLARLESIDRGSPDYARILGQDAREFSLRVSLYPPPIPTSSPSPAP